VRALLLAVLLALLAPAVADAACRSRALGLTNNGRLACGVQLPGETDALVTWDFPLERSPNRGWRRWGTSKLVAEVEQISIDYGVRFPIGPRLVVGDLSRRGGGPFGVEYGGVGHASHQNGLDVDIYYPRADGRELAPRDATEIDRRLSQELVDRFLAAGAQVIFVGPNTGLDGPPERVQPLVHHDNHLHVRLEQK
jgi:murein endopeptidase